LLGNPSDQYEGRAIALVLRDFSAQVTIEPADRFEIVAGEDDQPHARDLRAMVSRLERDGCYGGVRLLQATLLGFARISPELQELPEDDPRLRFRMRYGSEVPRQAGMSGSSAIVIAGLRALADWFGTPLDPDRQAETALAAEVEDLGIQAGPMDRVIQAHGGFMYMDFATSAWRTLDARLLPPLFVAWDPDPGRDSGGTHQSVRSRWDAGDAQVREAMRVFPTLADAGVECLEKLDTEGLCRLVDRNFDLRSSIYTLHASDLAMVRIGREHGAGVKLCGSGGSVIGVLRDEARRAELERAYADAGYRVLNPELP
jgi:glucuronokinase